MLNAVASDGSTTGAAAVAAVGLGKTSIPSPPPTAPAAVTESKQAKPKAARKKKAASTSLDGAAGADVAAADAVEPPYRTLPPWSAEHERALLATEPSLLVTGVAGCGKTALLIRLALKHFLAGRSVLIMTLVGSVKEEIAERLNHELPRPIRVTGANHRTRTITPALLQKAKTGKTSAAQRQGLAQIGLDINTAVAGGRIQISTIDAVIHQSLMQLDQQWLSDNLDRHDLKVGRLRSLLEPSLRLIRKSPEGGLDLNKLNFYGPTLKGKEGLLADVLLIDEFQDVDVDRAQLLSEMSLVGKRVRKEAAAAHQSGTLTSKYERVLARLSSSSQVDVDGWDPSFFLALVVGDPLQTIFDHAIDGGLEKHPFELWRSTTAPAEHIIRTCYRCPQSHIDLTNVLMKEHQEQHEVGYINHVRPDGPGTRPILFAHEPASNNESSNEVATRVVVLIAAYMDHDPSLKPADVVVIMPKVNANSVMNQLEDLLEAEYIRRGCVYEGKGSKAQKKKAAKAQGVTAALGSDVAEAADGVSTTVDDDAVDAAADADGATETTNAADEGEVEIEEKRADRQFVHVFATETDSHRIAIKWAKSQGKTALCSIHAMKGRSARCVIAVGMTEGSVPRASRVFEETELVDQSMLNVALTRSTQYLAIGFHTHLPSRYILFNNAHLSRHAVLAWDESTAVDAHERRILAAYVARMELEGMDNPIPKWGQGRYLQARSGRPDQLVFGVRRLADRNSKIIDGHPLFDPALWTREALHNASKVTFPAAVDRHDDLINITMGIMGEMCLRMRLKDPAIVELEAVIRALGYLGGAPQKADAAQDGSSGNAIVTTLSAQLKPLAAVDAALPSYQRTGSVQQKAGSKFRSNLSQFEGDLIQQPAYDIIFTSNDKALAFWCDTGVNMRILHDINNQGVWWPTVMRDDIGIQLLQSGGFTRVSSSSSSASSGRERLPAAVEVIVNAYQRHLLSSPSFGADAEDADAGTTTSGSAPNSEKRRKHLTRDELAAVVARRRYAFRKPVMLVDASLRDAPDTGHLLSQFSSRLDFSSQPVPVLWAAAVACSMLTSDVRRGRHVDMLTCCPADQQMWWPQLKENIRQAADTLQRQHEAALPAALKRLRQRNDASQRHRTDASGAAAIGDASKSQADAELHRQLQLQFGAALSLTITEDDPAVLQAMSIPAPFAVLGVRGFSDVYDPATETVIEVKVGMGSDVQRNPAQLWASQCAIYGAMLPADARRQPASNADAGAGGSGGGVGKRGETTGGSARPRYTPKRLVVVDLGSASTWRHTGYVQPRQEDAAAADASATDGLPEADAEVDSDSGTGAGTSNLPVASLPEHCRDFLSLMLQAEKYRPEHISRILRRGTGASAGPLAVAAAHGARVLNRRPPPG